MNKKPDWLRTKISNAAGIGDVAQMLRKLNLHTVCEEANCPNIMECFSKKTATFMIMGRVCTRNCTFCTVSKGETTPLESDEPLHVAEAILELGLKHAVITSVTRDDLPDGGAGHFARVIEKIRSLAKDTVIEVLIPDFQGSREALLEVVRARPNVINHNIETIKRLYPSVRPLADYDRSLELIRSIKELDAGIYSKSGLMLGLGEKPEEVEKLLSDLRYMNCDIVTIGQYLAPSKQHHPVVEYITPEVFARYKILADDMGFKYVASAPLVRSSYHAGEAFSPK